MRALLLAAGLGTRLRPITNVIPKCLVPLNGRPLLQYWLEDLVALGVDRILVNLHHHDELVERYLRGSQYSDLVETVTEKRLLGTGGTLLESFAFWSEHDLLVAHADNLMFCHLPDFVKCHSERRPYHLLTLMTFDTDDPTNCGIVVSDADGNISDFQEKPAIPAGNCASAAVFLISPALQKFLPSFLSSGALDFSRDILPSITKYTRVWHNAEYHRDIGTIASFIEGQISCPRQLRTRTPPSSAWSDMLLTDRRKLLNALSDTLVTALGAKQLYFADARIGIRQYCAGEISDVLLVTRYTEDKIAHIQRIDPDGRCLVVFQEVPCDFCSREFFLRTGRRSLGLMVTDVRTP